METLIQLFCIFFILVGSHFVCDYVLQTDAIAKGKDHTLSSPQFGVPWYYWMAAHCYTHGFGVGLVAYLFTNNLVISALFIFKEFTAHWVIDYLKCDKRINLHQDQILHLIYKLIFSIFIIVLI